MSWVFLYNLEDDEEIELLTDDKYGNHFLNLTKVIFAFLKAWFQIFENILYRNATRISLEPRKHSDYYFDVKKIHFKIHIVMQNGCIKITNYKNGTFSYASWYICWIQNENERDCLIVVRNENV